MTFYYKQTGLDFEIVFLVFTFTIRMQEFSFHVAQTSANKTYVTNTDSQAVLKQLGAKPSKGF